MAINETELRAAIEAVLLVAGEPITLNALVEVFGEKEKSGIETCLEQITSAYAESTGGFTLEKAAGGYRFVTRPELDSYLKKFFSRQGEGRLSIAALETLAIVAYKQPITAPEIADIRGVNSSGVLRTLLDRKLIRIAGRKNVVGSPFLYKTTKDFLLHFGLNSIQDLPRLEEFAEILGESLADELLGGEDAGAILDEISGENEADGVELSGSADDGVSDGGGEAPVADAEAQSAVDDVTGHAEGEVADEQHDEEAEDEELDEDEDDEEDFDDEDEDLDEDDENDDVDPDDDDVESDDASEDDRK